MNKILFLHTPKAAGQYITVYFKQLIDHEFIIPSQPVHTTNKTVWYDFDRDELCNIAHTANHVYVDTHYFTPFPGGNNQIGKTDWALTDKEALDTFKLFKDNGWFTFSFVRNPKEQLCSLYFFGRDNYKTTNLTWISQTESLDEFIKRYHGESPMPKFWDRLDYVAEFSDNNFDILLSLFGHKHIRLQHKNASSNRGFKFYYDLGMVSQDAADMIESSEAMKIYNDILRS